ncbi:unnamed protein product, partial [Meganyctiphanes norvegica]
EIPAIDPFQFLREFNEGQRTQITCSVSQGDLPMTINWLKNGGHLQHDPNIETKMISDFSKALVFRKLQEHHAGSYTCEVTNIVGSANHSATLRIKVRPRWITEPQDQSVLLGSSVMLECSAQGYPQPFITWMTSTGNSQVMQNFNPIHMDGIHKSQSSNGSLIIHSAMRSDAGWYRCQADNSVGEPLQKVVQMLVNAPANIETESATKTIHIGRTMILTCEASGDSPLSVEWLRHHSPLVTGKRISVNSNGFGDTVRAVLEIRNMNAHDDGQYTCRATNHHGQHSQVFTVTVLEPPTAPHNVITDDITSRTATISWSLSQPASVTIQYKVAEESSWSASGRNISVGAWTTSHELIGLEPFKKYALRLFTVNELGVSQPSSTIIFTTSEEAPSGFPEGVRVVSGGQRSLLVSWRPPKTSLLHGPLRGYILAYRRQSAQGSFDFITRPVTAPGLPVEEKYTLTGLQPSTFYEVAVQAFTKSGLGPLSSPRIVHATDVDVPSCPPVGVTCRSSGRRSIRIWWSPPQSSCENNSVTGYKILALPTKNLCPVYNAPWEVNTTNLEKSLDFLPPASNLSIQLRALNSAGIGPSSQPILCTTLDEEPGAPENLQLRVMSETRVLVRWEPPSGCHGTISHYTLSYTQRNKPQVDLHVRAGDMENTWKEINDLTPGIRLEVWLTASTMMGESGPSTRISVLPTQTSSSPPIALTGRQVWQVSEGSGVTLGCRAQGAPTPTISWMRDSQAVSSSHLIQLLPGGDLHVNG